MTPGPGLPQQRQTRSHHLMATTPSAAVRTFAREEFYTLVWTRPMTSLAAEFGISDVALHKTCRKHGIPKPPQGWWSKVGHGKVTSPPPLPSRNDGTPIVIGAHARRLRATSEASRSSAPPAPKSTKRPREAPDPFVTYTVAKLRRAEPDYRDMVTWREGRAIRVQVGRSSLHRVEPILQRLAAALRTRGVAFAVGRYAVVAGKRPRQVSIKLTEMTTRVALDAVARARIMTEIFWRKKPRLRASETLPTLHRIPPCNHLPNGRLRVDLKLSERHKGAEARVPQHWIFHDAENWPLEMMVDDIADAIAAMTRG